MYEQVDPKTVQLSNNSKSKKKQIQDGSLLSLIVHNKTLKTTLKNYNVKVKDTSHNPVSIHKSKKYNHSA